jgi:hypothetical protein
MKITKLSEAYVRLVARDAFFWAWPLVNMQSRRLWCERISERMYIGAAPVAPLNELTMLTDYFAPDVRAVACPNQDVVYGAGLLALDKSAVVIQVPDFDGRFWVYQVVDGRTDSFAQLGTMHGTGPGFYLLAGPDWDGDVPAGIARVFRASTRIGNVIPRVFMDDTAEDRQAIQEILKSIMMYPVERYDGSMKTTDWASLKRVAGGSSGDGEMPWVTPDRFFDILPMALANVPPLAGEAARYDQVRAVMAAAKLDPALRRVMNDEASRADSELIAPLFQFRNYGLQLPNHWSTTDNSARFGTDYYSRTAVAKSNIFANCPEETKYFYQDLDCNGERLDGGKAYTVTFAAGALPPVRGFWSLTLYNEHHFFAVNDLGRYSLGTKSKSLRCGVDGSLTLYVQAPRPAPEYRNNWLPAPDNAAFSLYLRAYWPAEAIASGEWTPPAVIAFGKSNVIARDAAVLGDRSARRG